ncbi:MAG: Glucose-1-phosphate cytidylyltransferase [Ignavibacteriaceae bacterium]|nr:Glucose-1-phosphate cytidylyltransferase [Ignavibacteriaceae bacterium]
MKTVILAGGYGTRLSEETSLKPKPMVEIGGRPILWHILKIYSYFGFNEFIICLGYKGFVIKEYFANYFLHQSDVTINLSDNSLQVINNTSEPWKITLIDTGETTMTGGRLLRIKNYIGGETFMMTYGDGIANINIKALIDFHNADNKIATLTAAQPTGRFGVLNIDDNNAVKNFNEKPKGEGGWVNAGFFVLERRVFDYLKDDTTTFEKEPLQRLAMENQLNAYHHNDFWLPMDKLSDKNELEKMWAGSKPPWKIWK